MRDGAKRRWTAPGSPAGVSEANQIRTSGSTRGSGRKALLRKCRLSLSTLPVPGSAGLFLLHSLGRSVVSFCLL